MHSGRLPPTHVALHIFIMQVLASQLHFLASRNAGMAIPPLFWPVNCIKIGGHVALLSDPTVHSLHCVAIKKNYLFFTSLGFLCSLDVNIFLSPASELFEKLGAAFDFNRGVRGRNNSKAKQKINNPL